MTMTLLIASALATTVPCLGIWLADAGRRRGHAQG
jgi:hypothetical protein